MSMRLSRFECDGFFAEHSAPVYEMTTKRELAVLLLHPVTTAARVLGTGGGRSIIAESLLVKQQLLLINRSR